MSAIFSISLARYPYSFIDIYHVVESLRDSTGQTKEDSRLKQKLAQFHNSHSILVALHNVTFTCHII